MYYENIIGPREQRILKKFALIPISIDGKIVWMKPYFQKQEKVEEVHTGCSDCFNPHGGPLFEQNRSNWVITKNLMKESL